MKKQVKIHLIDKTSYENKYNKDSLSYELSNYIMEETKSISSKDKIEFIVTSDFDITVQDKNKLVDMIRENFGTDVSEIINYSKKQIMANSLVCFIGIIFLLLYYVIVPEFISELTLILGWVFIGESICNFLYHGVENKLKIRKQKQIISAKVIFN